jgi:two-component system sensor histidine kinase KdpD
LRDLRTGLGAREVSVELPADLPLVRADAQLLHHCLINLIDNATRYSAPSGVIQIAASSDRGGVRLSVEDQGPGLPVDQERALDAFIRIEGSDRKGGAGLGLAIVKEFAEAMRATVTAANRPNGVGASFTLRFPRALAIAQETADAG